MPSSSIKEEWGKRVLKGEVVVSREKALYKLKEKYSFIVFLQGNLAVFIK